jgi:hypothetical protein
VEPEHSWSLEAVVAETRAEVRGLRSDVGELRAEVRSEAAELRQDFRRLDDRFFQLFLLQVGTLVAALGSLATALLS